MITFVDPVTGLDINWVVSLKMHKPFEENRNVAYAEAGDYIEPDTIYKGSYETTQLTTNPIKSDELPTFLKLVEATKKGGEILIDAQNVPLVGVVYYAIRLGALKPISTSSGKRFTFTLNLRVLRLDT